MIAENNQVGVKIVIAYQVLVLAQPLNPKPDLIATRSGSTIRFKNNGNTNILLREGKQCPSKDSLDEECEIFKGNRLYAGNEWTIKLPNSQPVKYYLSIGTKNSIKEY
ncbi:MAG: hypothetical protein GKR92_08420 [Gammaproteobacteria bacterium]|nr:MAG: hypothetical protein GKR92_08420 [Gammaproteobacteria bacterium]